MTGLYTSSWPTLYRHRDHLDVTPVRISTTFPRFWQASVMFPSLELLVPRGIVFKYEGDEFERRYLGRLAKIGPRRIEQAILELEAKADKPLCFTCYEVDPERCHRTMLRRFMYEHGLVIEEWIPGLPHERMAQCRRAGK